MQILNTQDPEFLRLIAKYFSKRVDYNLLDFNPLVQRVMDLDSNIRFAAVCDMQGNQLATKSREGIQVYLNEEETKESLQHAVNSWKSRIKLFPKIGKGRYVLAVYEKLRRVTLPLGEDHLLLVTIDNKGGQEDILQRLTNLIFEKDYTKF